MMLSHFLGKNICNHFTQLLFFSIRNFTRPTGCLIQIWISSPILSIVLVTRVYGRKRNLLVPGSSLCCIFVWNHRFEGLSWICCCSVLEKSLSSILLISFVGRPYQNGLTRQEECIHAIDHQRKDQKNVSRSMSNDHTTWNILIQIDCHDILPEEYCCCGIDIFNSAISRAGLFDSNNIRSVPPWILRFCCHLQNFFHPYYAGGARLSSSAHFHCIP